jgi:hypothetical protein
LILIISNKYEPKKIIIRPDPIDKIFVSDSIYHASLPDKFVTVFIDALLTHKL